MHQHLNHQQFQAGIVILLFWFSRHPQLMHDQLLHLAMPNYWFEIRPKQQALNCLRLMQTCLLTIDTKLNFDTKLN